MSNVFIIDIDHTIFDSDRFDQHEAAVLARYRPLTMEQFLEAKNQIRDQHGRFTLVELVTKVLEGVPHKEERVSEAIKQIFRVQFGDFFYESVRESFFELMDFGSIVIFSQGEERLQRAKVSPLIDEAWVKKEQVTIVVDKLLAIPQFASGFANDKKFVFDDHKRYLKQFSEVDPASITVLIETQEIGSEDREGLGFTPTVSAKTFFESTLAVKRYFT